MTMNAWKAAAIALITISCLWDRFIDFRSIRGANNPTPENVKDVYDAETYQRWRAYHRDGNTFDIVFGTISWLISVLLIQFDVFARAAGSTANVYWAAIIVTLVDVGARLIPDTVASYINTMVIEEKYGFNRSTQKTFWLDQAKSLPISLLLSVGLLCLFIVLHRTFGDAMIVFFVGAVFIIELILAFLSPQLLKIFNKFTPLEDGELRDKLTALLEKNGYRVKDIKVMDASRRSTKSNAFFTGFGKSKTIVLYDTLLESSTTNEICAVFAHEMGHGIHKDTLKNTVLGLIQIVIIAVLAWLLIRFPDLYRPFGFSGLNYGMAFVLLSYCIFPAVSQPLSVFTSWHSRRAEYRADRKAVEEGYGADLIASLKKLAKENFSNLSPDPLIVKLAYSHPPLSQRIAAIEREQKS